CRPPCGRGRDADDPRRGAGAAGRRSRAAARSLRARPAHQGRRIRARPVHRPQLPRSHGRGDPRPAREGCPRRPVVRAYVADTGGGGGGGVTKKPAILVVEDEEQMLRVLRPTLEAQDYRVATVTTGEAALQALAGEPFSVMILDL